MSPINLNIFSRIRNYRKLSSEIQEALLKSPSEVSKFQAIFNLTVDRIYQDIMDFERENIDKAEEDIYKLKKIFEKRYRRYFLYGDYIKWCANKPFGYSGDFKIIDDIYQNQVRTEGFDKLWDIWFLELAASYSVRERKEDFKKFILDFTKTRSNRDLRFMDLACGPAREIKELLETDNNGLFSKVIFDCYDLDERAIVYARQILNSPQNVNFTQKNAVRLALKKEITSEIPYKYDLIYSTGLFDYLDERVAVRLVSNLRKLIKKDGIIIISNARDKYSNSSSTWMEWIGDWYLIYRAEEEFKKIFVDAGFPAQDVQILAQKSKVMQYCLVRT
ncbi:MAG: class I SAM-dependent methyltransferase [Candidatus Omnitrophica bacterium]|nr:class I SAM-dependent methyltransferase [Candidatus Omnitrophota bacterium]